ncbi:hypothetical protein EJ08DRAFT_701653 [Tothia fuscella]|uniref:Uncharacterized protein n=1 Tax=Tothia fuscella TaxID=1048955 RepID=A0A9P4TTD4_9PEZI|nr:hypothetical protein EJ08DRAFT_701653 [Tothia fuscella]
MPIPSPELFPAKTRESPELYLTKAIKSLETEETGGEWNSLTIPDPPEVRLQKIEDHVHKVLTSAPASFCHGSINIWPTGQYHLIKLRYAYLRRESDKDHPDLIGLKEKLNARHYALVVCSCNEDGRVFGQVFELARENGRTSNQDGEHPNNQIAWMQITSTRRYTDWIWSVLRVDGY